MKTGDIKKIGAETASIGREIAHVIAQEIEILAAQVRGAWLTTPNSNEKINVIIFTRNRRSKASRGAEKTTMMIIIDHGLANVEAVVNDHQGITTAHEMRDVTTHVIEVVRGVTTIITKMRDATTTALEDLLLVVRNDLSKVG